MSRGSQDGRESGEGDHRDEPGTVRPAHPGPGSAVLPAHVRDEFVAQARAEYPNEACGLIIGERAAAEGGRALRYEPTRNAAASPYRYSIDSADLLRVTLAADDADQVIWGICHSHVRSPARPSPTDVGLAFYPDALYLLVSLTDMDAPDVRAWRIVEGVVHEVPLVTEPDAPIRPAPGAAADRT